MAMAGVLFACFLIGFLLMTGLVMTSAADTREPHTCQHYQGFLQEQISVPPLTAGNLTLGASDYGLFWLQVRKGPATQRGCRRAAGAWRHQKWRPQDQLPVLSWASDGSGRGVLWSLYSLSPGTCPRSFVLRGASVCAYLLHERIVRVLSNASLLSQDLFLTACQQ